MTDRYRGNNQSKPFQRHSKTPTVQVPDRFPGQASQPVVERNKKGTQIVIERNNVKRGTSSLVITKPSDPKPTVEIKTTQQPSPDFPSPSQIAMQPNRPQPNKPCIPDSFSRFTVASFISSFREGHSFNETDLSSLGIDLQSRDPLIPDLYSIFSESPMLTKSYHRIPQSFSNVSFQKPTDSMFQKLPTEALLFAFFEPTNEELGRKAKDELEHRGLVYENGQWIISKGRVWDVAQWKEIDAK